jgi:hypothetical protein
LGRRLTTQVSRVIILAVSGSWRNLTNPKPALGFSLSVFGRSVTFILYGCRLSSPGTDFSQAVNADMKKMNKDNLLIFPKVSGVLIKKDLG